MSSRVAAELDEIRQRYAARPGDVERLLAIADATLKLADKWLSTPWPDEGGDRAGVTVEQIILDGGALREAIGTALLGAPATHPVPSAR